MLILRLLAFWSLTLSSAVHAAPSAAKVAIADGRPSEARIEVTGDAAKDLYQFLLRSGFHEEPLPSSVFIDSPGMRCIRKQGSFSCFLFVQENGTIQNYSRSRGGFVVHN